MMMNRSIYSSSSTLGNVNKIKITSWRIIGKAATAVSPGGAD